jgi:paraquat-inducible protein B
MSDKTQNVATGAFVVGALLIAIVTLLYLLGSGLRQTEKFIMVFDGAAKGLNVGAPIALRGVQIGQVTDVDVVFDTRTADLYVVVTGQIDDSTIRYRGDPNKVSTEDLIERGLRAQLNIQSLVTGLLYIEMDFHPNSPINLVDIDSDYDQFPTIPTSLERLAAKLENFDLEAFNEKLKSIGEGVEAVLGSEEFQQLPANMNGTLVSLRELSDQLQTQVARSGPRLDSVLEQASTGIAKANTELTAAIYAFQQSMENLNDLTSDDSATLYQLNMALQEVSRASRSLRQLATTLENQPEALLQGKGGDP